LTPPREPDGRVRVGGFAEGGAEFALPAAAHDAVNGDPLDDPVLLDDADVAVVGDDDRLVRERLEGVLGRRRLADPLHRAGLGRLVDDLQALVGGQRIERVLRVERVGVGIGLRGGLLDEVGDLADRRVRTSVGHLAEHAAVLAELRLAVHDAVAVSVVGLARIGEHLAVLD
ncbi:MAG: hypothetical protein ACK559_34155, partial [bacterium]